MSTHLIRLRVLVVGVLLISVSLACGLPAAIIKQQRPPTTVPMTTEQVQQFEQQVQATIENPAPNGDITLTFTEQQINAYVEAQLAAQPDQTITEPQIHLTNGQIELYGKVNLGDVPTDATAIVLPTVDANGKPVIQIQSLKVGPLPVPDVLVSQINQQLGTSLADFISQNSPNLNIKNITITEGQMSVTGTMQ